MTVILAADTLERFEPEALNAYSLNRSDVLDRIATARGSILTALVAVEVLRERVAA